MRCGVLYCTYPRTGPPSRSEPLLGTQARASKGGGGGRRRVLRSLFASVPAPAATQVCRRESVGDAPVAIVGLLLAGVGDETSPRVAPCTERAPSGVECARSAGALSRGVGARRRERSAVWNEVDFVAPSVSEEPAGATRAVLAGCGVCEVRREGIAMPRVEAAMGVIAVERMWWGFDGGAGHHLSSRCVLARIAASWSLREKRSLLTRRLLVKEPSA